MRSFGRGGVHPPEMKLTSGSAIIDAPLPRSVVLSLSQSLGRPATPAVAVGEHVDRFQIVGCADGPISANVHTPISGTVKSVAETPGADGHKVMAVTIVADDADHLSDIQSIADAAPLISIETALGKSRRDIAQAIADAGIVGLGGATFPTAVKVSPEAIERSGVKEVTLLINGSECEPYLTCDEAIMREMPNEIVQGIRILMHVAGAKEAIIGIENNKPEAIKAMSIAARRFDNIRIVALRTRYPQGGEKMLTKALTGRKIAPGKLPVSEGVIIQNVATALAVYHAMIWGIPLVERVLTVSGRDVARKANVRAVIGTPLSEIAALAGGIPESTVRIVAGGTMMGRSLASIEGATTKGLSGLLLLDSGEVSNRKVEPCVRCGRCQDSCPMGLQPYLLARLSELRLIDRALEAHLMDCMECGCCTYSCIAGRPVADFIRIGKLQARQSLSKKSP